MRRWPRISASSRMPPRLMRENFRPKRIGDRLAEAGFADAWRSEETQDRSPAFGIQFAHGEIFDEAAFDLFQIVVIAIENFAGPG